MEILILKSMSNGLLSACLLFTPYWAMNCILPLPLMMMMVFATAAHSKCIVSRPNERSHFFQFHIHRAAATAVQQHSNFAFAELHFCA